MKRLTALLLVAASILYALPSAHAKGPAAFSASFAGLFENLGSCAQDPNLFTTEVAGGGNASHLGRARFVAEHCFDSFLSLSSGKLTIIGANGDNLFATYEGQLFPVSDVEFNLFGTLTFTGGTGRFENASGICMVHGAIKLVGPTTGQAIMNIGGRIILK